MLNHRNSCISDGYENIQFMQYVTKADYLKFAIHTIAKTQTCENEAMVFSVSDLFDFPTNIHQIQNKINIKKHFQILPLITLILIHRKSLVIRY